MAISLKHAFNSPKADGTDPTLVQPSNWNAEHTITMDAGRLLGRSTAGTGTAEEIALGTTLTLASGTLAVSASPTFVAPATVESASSAVPATLIVNALGTQSAVLSLRQAGVVRGALTGTATGVDLATSPSSGTMTLTTAGTARQTIGSTGDVTFSGTGAVKVHSGTTAQRPGTPVTGQFRYNTTTNGFEGYNGTAWGAVGGGAKGGGADAIFYENGQTVTTDYTIAAGTNAMSAGPISVNSGVTVTVPSGSVWTIV